MRFIRLLLYLYMGLFTLIGYVLYYDIHHFNPSGPKLLDHKAKICKNDCPLEGLRVFLNEDNKLSTEASEDIRTLGHIPPGMSIVLTAHPEARYWKAHAILDWITNSYRDQTIYFRIGETQLPSLDMPYWPADIDFSDFKETLYTVEIGADNIIRIGGIEDEFIRLDDAMERILVMAQNPSIEIFIAEGVENYLKVTAKHLCETTQFECRIALGP